jgi:hypothetical protein
MGLSSWRAANFIAFVKEYVVARCFGRASGFISK